MAEVLEKPKLFLDIKSFVWFCLLLLTLLALRVWWEYSGYKAFITKPFYYTYATVIDAYSKTKNNHTYQVIKLRADEGFVFYTTTYSKEPLKHLRLRLKLLPSKEIPFMDYLRTFYIPSIIKEKEKLPLDVKGRLLQKVAFQHTDASIASFYNAIFFATLLDKNLRDKVSLLGISHLVALSGFHLGLLWGLVYGVLLLLYRPLQQRYFPYRYALFDLGVVTMLFLGAYLWFVDFPPSLVRSYAMLLVGWVMVLLGIELLSFSFLVVVVLALLSLLPSLLVSLGFWLSVSGVFYIYLLLLYTQKFNAWSLKLLIIPLGIFILMLPIIHTIFGATSGYQLLSPLLSVVFIAFYPLVILLHIVGFGDLLDAPLLWLFALPQNAKEMLLEPWVGVVYILLSLGAIAHRYIFGFLVTLASLYMLYLFIFIQ